MSMIALALLAGVLVSLSRQINGRLSLATSPMASSFWNHIVGFGILTVIALIFGGLWPADGPPDPPLLAYISGTIGVIFIAASSWLITRIGAVNTALMIIAGQMVSGVVLDAANGIAGTTWMRGAGVAMIIAGMWLAQRRRA
jgi:transporter family-2 protein